MMQKAQIQIYLDWASGASLPSRTARIFLLYSIVSEYKNPFSGNMYMHTIFSLQLSGAVSIRLVVCIELIWYIW